MPDCSKCLPKLYPENVGIYEVYYRVFGAIENVDVFKIMKLIGIKQEDQLFVFDLIGSVRNEVLKRNEVLRNKDKK